MLAKFKSRQTRAIGRRKPATVQRNTVAPLPAELLIEIFLYCLPADGFPCPSRREAPLLLGRVCRTWREVTLNTPQLWAQITLSFSLIQDIWVSKSFHEIGLPEWLRRSGTCPLSFGIEWHSELHSLAPFFSITLRAEAHRWKAIRLRSTCHCINHILQTVSTPGKTPMLQDLRFVNEAPFRTDHSIVCAPQLKTIHLRVWYPPFLDSGRLYSVRELRINPCANLEVYSWIFTQCPKLEILEIITPWYPLDDTQTVIHTLPHLHTFILDGSLHGPLILLDQFDTPALNSLAMSVWGDTRKNSTHLVSFLMRCGSKLHHLKVGMGCLSFDGLIDCLRHTPSLESLCVEPSLLAQELQTLCPQLVHFDIYGSQFAKDQTMVAIGTFILRWKESKSWSSVIMSPVTLRVDLDNLSMLLKIQEIKHCIDQGLHVAQTPLISDCWWAARLRLPEAVHSRVIAL
ncbi:hypothetical protein BD410DRAFT_212844 [Rickenella mellea]|uniref:F-box domain-containing protein n=1 Tax=Rickenella mellea TaxID=50990 RepID=A0A4Y7Q754_9AGAM|nr:hypothetical protein BD410DRAFT_212844 [Rickenella mellea]